MLYWGFMPFCELMKWRFFMALNKNKLPAAGNAAEKKRWWTKKKIIAASLIGVAVIATAVVVGVILATSVRPIPSTEEEARVVGEVGGYEVRYEELRYITLMHRESLDAELGEYEKLDEKERSEYETLLEARVMEDVKKNYVILSLCDKYGIKTDASAVKSHVNDEMKTYVKDDFGGSMSKYKEWLKENNLTDSFIRFNFKINFLESELLKHFIANKIDIEYDGQSVNEFIEYVMSSEDWARTVHAYYPKKSDVIDTSNSKTRAENARDTVLAVARDADRYDAMRREIGKAPFVAGFSTTGNGLYFTYGQMGEEYESASFSLELYGVSDVIETEDGYYVIMRLPLDEDDVKAQVDTLLVQYQYASLKGQMDVEREKLSFVGNDYFGSISLIGIE